MLYLCSVIFETMIKFTEDQLAVIEIIGYTPKLIKDKDGKSKLMLDWSIIPKDQQIKILELVNTKDDI